MLGHSIYAHKLRSCQAHHPNLHQAPHEFHWAFMSHILQAADDMHVAQNRHTPCQSRTVLVMCNNQLIVAIAAEAVQNALVLGHCLQAGEEGFLQL